MSKWKAGLVTGVTALLFGSVLYLTNSYSIRHYRIFEFILAMYGFIQAVFVLYEWLRMESPKEQGKKHLATDMDPVRSGETIPKGWLNPFDKKKTEPEKEDKNVPERPGPDQA